MKTMRGKWMARVCALLLATATLVGCGTTMQTASDAAALSQAMEDVDQTIESYADELPADDRTKVEEAWSQIRSAHEAITSGDGSAAQEYHRARFAYAQIRGVVEKHWDDLSSAEQDYAQELDRRAQRLDERLREGDEVSALQIIEVATMLAPYIKAVAL